MVDESGRATGAGGPEELSPELEQLLGLARESLSGRPPRRSAASPQQLERALAGRSRRRRSAAAALFACAALLGSALLFLWLRPSQEVALGFEVAHGTLSQAGVVEATAEGTRVTFSDGTELALAAHGRARVEAVSAHGAELGLEQGRAKLDVVRLPGARWSVRAGPYLVRVTGTSFELEFEPEQRWLKLDLLVGSVSVSGPLIDGALHVSAGQRLLVRPGDALVLVQRREAEPALLAPADSAPAVVAPEVAAPAVVAPPVAVEPAPVVAPRGLRSAAGARAARREGSSRRRVSEPTPVPVAPAAEESWRQKVAAGRFAEVIALAEARELEQLLRQAPPEDLEALADAARYVRRSELARSALLALRERFAGSRAARDAAFLLGRLDEGEGATSTALGWYQRYLSDDPSGPYASQALGRQLSLSRELGQERARALAREYLQRFPRGPYAARARELSGGK